MPFLDEIAAAIARAGDIRGARFDGLQSGTAILGDDAALDAYLASYGEMHHAKIIDAMSRIDLAMLAAHPFEIWDWGCGVGLALFCLLDQFAVSRIATNKLFRVVLVEASQVALDRATFIVRRDYPTVMETASVHLTRRSFDQVTNGMAPTAPFASKLHLFSNVLDMQRIDAGALGATIARMFAGLNKFVLVSPGNYRTADAFDRFSRAIQAQASAYATVDHNDDIRGRIIYRPLSRAREVFTISRRERIITAVLG